MRIGLHLSNHASAAPSIELARRAEAEGLDSVWISEDLYFRGAVPIAGAIAGATQSISIGFGVLTPYNRHVSLMAMELAALIDIAGPRIIAGLGAGVAARVRGMRTEYANPVTAVGEVVEALRRLLAGESLSYAGLVHGAVDLKLSFEDLPPMPPVYVAAIGPKALEQAGAIADGVILSLMATRKHVAWARQHVAAGAAARARDAAIPLLAYVPIAMGQGRAEAIDSMRPYIAYYVKRWANIESLAQLFTRWGPVTQTELTTMAARLERGADPREVIPDALVTEYCVAGTFDDCVEQTADLHASGVSDVIFDLTAHTAGRGETIASLGRVRRALRERRDG